MRSTNKKTRARRVRTGPVSPSEASERQQLIIRIATDEFLDKGYERASLTEISRRCRISKTTLYELFRTKEALFSYIATASISEHRYNMDHALDTRRPFMEVIRHVVGLMVNATATVPRANSILKLAISERDRFPAIGRLSLDHSFELVRPLGKYLKSVSEVGALTNHEAHVMAYHLLSMACGGYGCVLVDPAIFYTNRSEWIRLTVRLFVAGFPISRAATRRAKHSNPK